MVDSQVHATEQALSRTIKLLLPQQMSQVTNQAKHSDLNKPTPRQANGLNYPHT